MGKRLKYYTVYLAETDEVVAFGSSEECTEKLGLKNIEQFYAMVSKTKSGLNTRYAVVVDEEMPDK